MPKLKGFSILRIFSLRFFFVVDAKIDIFPLTSKSLDNYFNISHRKSAKFVLRQTAEPFGQGWPQCAFIDNGIFFLFRRLCQFFFVILQAELTRQWHDGMILFKG